MTADRREERRRGLTPGRRCSPVERRVRRRPWRRTIGNAPTPSPVRSERKGPRGGPRRPRRPYRLGRARPPRSMRTRSPTRTPAGAAVARAQHGLAPALCCRPAHDRHVDAPLGDQHRRPADPPPTRSIPTSESHDRTPSERQVADHLVRRQSRSRRDHHAHLPRPAVALGVAVDATQVGAEDRGGDHRPRPPPPPPPGSTLPAPAERRGHAVGDLGPHARAASPPLAACRGAGGLDNASRPTHRPSVATKLPAPTTNAARRAGTQCGSGTGSPRRRARPRQPDRSATANVSHARSADEAADAERSQDGATRDANRGSGRIPSAPERAVGGRGASLSAASGDPVTTTVVTSATSAEDVAAPRRSAGPRDAPAVGVPACGHDRVVRTAGRAASAVRGAGRSAGNGQAVRRFA